MLTVRNCRKINCDHLKNKISFDYNAVAVCDITGRLPRCMEMCPELEEML